MPADSITGARQAAARVQLLLILPWHSCQHLTAGQALRAALACWWPGWKGTAAISRSCLAALQVLSHICTQTRK